MIIKKKKTTEWDWKKSEKIVSSQRVIINIERDIERERETTESCYLLRRWWQENHQVTHKAWETHDDSYRNIIKGIFSKLIVEN